MKNVLRLIAVVCVCCFVFGCASKPAQPVEETVAPVEEPAAEVTPAPTEAPTPEPVKADISIEGEELPYISGTVLAVGENDITVQMDNGNTFNFVMNRIDETIAQTGDEVSVYYLGDLTNCPEAMVINVTKVDPVQSITGTVLQHDASTVFIEIGSSDVLGFSLTKDTNITGVSDIIMAGDTVDITFDGDLLSNPVATQIEVLTVGASNRKDDTEETSNTVNKHLNGTIFDVSSSKLVLKTSTEKTYTFRLTADTKYVFSNGISALRKGLRVRITYDGFASKNPNAKEVEVVSSISPTPTHSSKHTTFTVSGIVESFGGMWLSLSNGYGFDVSYASYGGSGKRVPGEYATVTYYHADGIRYATKIVFEPVIY